MNSRLRIPLSKLWPDIACAGLPVWHQNYRQGIVILSCPDHAFVGCCTSHPHGGVDYVVPRLPIHQLSLDLSRPGASDILARRVATCFQWDFRWDPKVWRGYIDGHNHPGRHGKVTFWWAIEDEDYAHLFDLQMIPALADLNPISIDRLDWGNLGSPRVVDLVALGIVAQHLLASEKPLK